MKNSNISILAERIINGVRNGAKKIPAFDNGIIRLVFIPRDEAAFSFWGIARHDSDIVFIDTIRKADLVVKNCEQPDLKRIPKTSIHEKIYHVLYTDNFSLSKAPDPVLYFDVVVLVSGSSEVNNMTCANTAGVILTEWCNTITQPDCLGHLEKYLSVEYT